MAIVAGALCIAGTIMVLSTYNEVGRFPWFEAGVPALMLLVAIINAFRFVYNRRKARERYAGAMSIAVALDELGRTLEGFRFAYLVTVGEQGVHVLSVSPIYREGTLTVSTPGRRTRANLSARADATLVWPPADPEDHSLIVDGTGAVHEETVVITPGKAVLHRPAPPAEPG